MRNRDPMCGAAISDRIWRKGAAGEAARRLRNPVGGSFPDFEQLPPVACDGQSDVKGHPPCVCRDPAARAEQLLAELHDAPSPVFGPLNGAPTLLRENNSRSRWSTTRATRLAPLQYSASYEASRKTGRTSPASRYPGTLGPPNAARPSGSTPRNSGCGRSDQPSTRRTCRVFSRPERPRPSGSERGLREMLRGERPPPPARGHGSPAHGPSRACEASLQERNIVNGDRHPVQDPGGAGVGAESLPEPTDAVL